MEADRLVSGEGLGAEKEDLQTQRKRRYEKTTQEDDEVDMAVAEGDSNVDTSVGPSKRKSVKWNEAGMHAEGPKSTSLWVDEGWYDKSIITVENTKDTSHVQSTSSEELENLKATALGNPCEANLLSVLEPVFGYKAFRNGQLVAIQRVLAMESTLLVLPTGKSLTYQLPAYVLPGLTLVISPLVALIADQLQHLPPLLPGGFINSSQTTSESTEVMSRLLSGEMKVLFITPERLFSESFLSALDPFPEISLAVVDEAHCLCEWSHNFRSSYYKLGSTLKQRLRVPCILALTGSCYERDRVRKDLLALLRSSPFSEVKSIIVYCTDQAEADDISRYLEEKEIAAKSYHSGRPSSERTHVLQLFCSNKLRVVVATVAFGMGLDKSNIGSVIHYNMPRSLEQYVEETGRAGRDGKPAFCHLFLDDIDYLELCNLAYSDGADTSAVNKFLCRVFQSPPDTSKSMTSINVEQTANELGLKEEVMATIFSFMEVGNVQYVHVHSKLKATCNLTFSKTSAALLAKHSALVATIVQRYQPKHGHCTFQVPVIANEAGLSLLQVQQELQRLQIAGEISYELQDLAFCFSVVEVPDDMCALTSSIAAQLSEVAKCKVAKLDAMYAAAATAASHCGEETSSNFESTGQQLSLQSSIGTYFGRCQDNPTTQVAPSIVESTRLVHESVGEGDNRHVITERCDESKWMKKKRIRKEKGEWSKAKKNKAQLQREPGLVECLFCKCSIPNSEVSLNQHYIGKTHRRLEELHHFIPFFEEFGIFPTIGKATYDCRVCGESDIPPSVKKLKAHLLNVHFVGSNILSNI